MKSRRRYALETWRAILPERTICLEDVNDLAETIVSTIQVHKGADLATVASSWDGDTALVVSNALQTLTTHEGGSGGLQRLS